MNSKLPASILIVEDDAEFAHMLDDALSLEGVRVTVAKNGQEGMGCFKAIKPDLVLLDLILPIVDGIKVAKFIRKLDGSVPIIAMSGQSKIPLAGFTYSLTKPFELDTLYQMIAASIAGNDSKRSA